MRASLVALLCLVLCGVVVSAALRVPGRHRLIEGKDNRNKIKKHSFSTPFDVSIPQWTFGGSVIASADFIRLTPDAQDKVGWVVNGDPIKIPNWEIHVEFKIHGKNARLGADGLALWIVESPGMITSGGPVFGGVDKFVGLGIFFDTFANRGRRSKAPMVAAMLNNGTIEYDNDRDGGKDILASCSAELRNVDHKTRASVRYKQGTLEVRLDIKGKNRWEKCFSIEDVDIPLGYHLGFTAMTGQISDAHELSDVAFFSRGYRDRWKDSNYKRKPSIRSEDGVTHKKENARRVSAQSSSFGGAIGTLFLYFVYFVLFIGVAAGGYLAYLKFGSKKKGRLTL